MMGDTGYDVLSPVGAWQHLEDLGRDGTQVQESSETIAGQPSSCVELVTDVVVVDVVSGVLACFLEDSGVLARFRLEMTVNDVSQESTVELTGYSTTADPALVEVPADAPVQG